MPCLPSSGISVCVRTTLYQATHFLSRSHFLSIHEPLSQHLPVTGSHSLSSSRGLTQPSPYSITTLSTHPFTPLPLLSTISFFYSDGSRTAWKYLENIVELFFQNVSLFPKKFVTSTSKIAIHMYNTHLK